MGQPQPDIGFLNELFNYTQRKKLDIFTNNRASKAVQACIKNDPIDGLHAQGGFYIYFNEPTKAIDLIENAIDKYGYRETFIDIILMAYQAMGDLGKQVSVTVNALELMVDATPENRYYKLFTKNLIATCTLFLDDSVAMRSALSFLPSDDKEAMINTIVQDQLMLKQIGISLDTYQRVISITSQVVNHYYHRGFKFEVILDTELDYAEIVIYFDAITLEQAIELNDEIDDEIIKEASGDAKFADEVSRLSVRCTLSYQSQEEALIG